MTTFARRNLQATEQSSNLTALDASLRHCARDSARQIRNRFHPCKKETSMKPTQQLHDLGQSLWLDNITRGGPVLQILAEPHSPLLGCLML
jgi:hypothetical protein